MSRVTATPQALYGVRVAKKRRRCDGHLAESHWIKLGDRMVVSALPPDSDVGNVGWWHVFLCSDCCPVEYADTEATR